MQVRACVSPFTWPAPTGDGASTEAKRGEQSAVYQ